MLRRLASLEPFGNGSFKTCASPVAHPPSSGIKGTKAFIPDEVVIHMEPEKRNQAKYYTVSYQDGSKPAKVVHGWQAVMDERRNSKSKVSAKGFHTFEVAERYRKSLLIGSVTFQKIDKNGVEKLLEKL